MYNYVSMHMTITMPTVLPRISVLFEISASFGRARGTVWAKKPLRGATRPSATGKQDAEAHYEEEGSLR